MKKILSFLIIMLAAVISYGQTPAPGIFNYQGVARNSVGNALVNKTINLRLTIHDGAAAGPVVYQESRLATTNPFGLFNVQVGSPGFLTQVGSVAAVNWGVNSKFIQVEIDPNGGTSFINVGTAQIASVPYALYSSLSNDLVLPFIKTQSAPASTLIGITNSATTGSQGAIMGTSASTDANAFAITGTISSAAPGGFSTGVRGINNGTGGLGIGVWGSQNGSGWGVYGTSVSGIGGNFSGGNGIGVFGSATTGTGGRFTTVTGLALHTTGGLRLQGILEGPPIAPTTFKLLAGDPLGNATWQHASAIGLISGSGTLNFVPKWTPNGTTLGNSQIFDNGTSVGINTITPNAAYRLEIQGLQRINATTNQEGGELRFQEGNLFGPQNHWIIDNFLSFAGGNKFRVWNDAGSMALQMMPTGRVAVGNMVFSDQPQSTLDVEGNLAVGAAYSGTTAAPANGAIIEGNVGIGTNAPGTRLHVVANAGGTATEILRNLNATGFSSTWYLSSAGGNMGHFGYGNPGAGLWANQMFAGSIAAIPFVFTTADIERMRITATGNVGIGTIAPITRLHVSGQTTIQDGTQGVNRLFFDNGAGVGTGEWRTPAGAGLVSGSGTLNYIAKWTPDGFTIGNSQIFDNGTNVGIGTIVPASRLDLLHTAPTSRAATVALTDVNNNSQAMVVSTARNVIESSFVSTAITAVKGPGAGFGSSSPATVYATSRDAHGAVGSSDNGIGVFGIGINGAAMQATSAGTAPGLNVFALGGGNGINVFHNQPTGLGISVQKFDPSNLNPAVDVFNAGDGRAGQFLSTTGTAVYGQTDGTTGNLFAMHGVVSSAAPGGYSAGVRGQNNGTGFLGIGVYGSQNGSGWGVHGYTPSGVGVYGFSNDYVGVWGEDDGAAPGGYGVVARGHTSTSIGLYADNTAGGINSRSIFSAGNVQLTGLNEATNRLLTSTDNFGNALWQDAAAVGLVSGSGTLNFVPKWTPNGTTLGNSQIFDNGFNVGIGTAAPGFKLDIASTVAVARLVDTDNGTQFGIAAPGAGYTGGVETITNHDLAIFSNNLDRMTIRANGDVGVGVLTPTNKFEVIQTGTTRAGLFQVNNVANTATALEVNHNGVALAIHAQSNAPGFCNCGVIDGLTTVTGANAVYGRGAGTNTWGVYGLSNNSAGTAGIGWLAGSVGVFGQGWLGSGGQFIIDNTIAGNISNALEVSNTQTGMAGNFVINNAASTSDVVYATTNSTSVTPSAVHAVNGVSGFLIFGKKGVWGESNNGLGVYGTSTSGIGVMGSTSTGTSGVHGFNSTGTAAVYAQHVGSGFGVYGFSQSGSAGRFENTNASNVNHTVNVTTNGIGNAIRAFSDKSISIVGWTGANSFYGSAGVYGINNSVGGNGMYATGNRFDDWGLLAHSDSSIGVYGESWYDKAGYFTNLGLNNTTANTVEIINAGKGHGVYAQTASYFQLANFYNPAAAFNAAGYFRGNAGTGVIGYAPGTYSHTGGGRVGVGVYGVADSVGSNYNYGLVGVGRGSVGENAGVIGYVDAGSGGAINAGVYGVAFAGPGARYAGYFDGNVQVNGNFAATGAKAFKIDHPLDPANKYLSHYAIESPEVQNVYNGNITTDANGKAIVKLPDYFEAVNRDFKYQLTIVDETQFAMARVSRKINGNHFELMTSVPGIEVSWQVTAVRNDKAAQKFAEPAESMKQGAEIGKYLNPELYGQGKEKGLVTGMKGVPAEPLTSKSNNTTAPTQKIADLKKQSLTGNNNLPNPDNKVNPVTPELSKLQKFETPGETQAETAIPDATAEKSRILAASLAPVQEAEYKTPVEKKGILSEEEALRIAGNNDVAPKQPGQHTNEKQVQQPQPAKPQIPARIQEYGNKMEQMRKEAGQQNKAATGIPVPAMPDIKQSGIQKAPESKKEQEPVKQDAGKAKTD